MNGHHLEHYGASHDGVRSISASLATAAATEAASAADSVHRVTVQDAIQTAREGAARQAVHVQYPWDQAAEYDVVTKCDDSCPAAKNKACNDGRGDMRLVSFCHMATWLR